MPSPFPGMDPFIERQAWEDFHTGFITHLADGLVPQVRPRYVVRKERRVYLDHPANDAEASFQANVAVLDAGWRGAGASSTAAVADRPVVLTLPIPDERREAFLTIHERETMEVVTVIELLSPSNKRAGGDGWHEYLRKRELVLRSSANLVEIDLLRGGRRLPTIEPLPAGHYCTLVSPERRRPKVLVYPWFLREPIPPLSVPLARGDDPVVVALQEVFGTVYDRAGYDYSPDHAAPVEPPLSDAELAWTRELLRTHPETPD